jgi:hypothetical protein
MCHLLLMITRRDFLAASFACSLQQSHSTKPSRTRVFPPEAIRFNEIAEQAGLDFVLQNNPTPRKHIIESMPGGVAAFDYNNDGRTDIFFTQRRVHSIPRKGLAKIFQSPLS